jgi:hypothetical protein
VHIGRCLKILKIHSYVMRWNYIFLTKLLQFVCNSPWVFFPRITCTKAPWTAMLSQFGANLGYQSQASILPH